MLYSRTFTPHNVYFRICSILGDVFMASSYSMWAEGGKDMQLVVCLFTGDLVLRRGLELAERSMSLNCASHQFLKSLLLPSLLLQSHSSIATLSRREKNERLFSLVSAAVAVLLAMESVTMRVKSQCRYIIQTL